MKTLEYTAGAEDTGRRIDAALAAAFPELTRSFAQQLLAEGRVLCNGRSVAKSARLTQGDALCVSLPDAQPVEIIPQDIPLDIVYEDGSLLVVNKPKGMVVHPAAGNPDGTLVNALLYHCAGRLSGINGEVRPGIVHRIDKDTSGLLVVAKDNETHGAHVHPLQIPALIGQAGHFGEDIAADLIHRAVYASHSFFLHCSPGSRILNPAT